MELEAVATNPEASPLPRALALLVQPEAEIPTNAGGITLEEFTQSVAYKEIFGQGRQEGLSLCRRPSPQELRWISPDQTG